MADIVTESEEFGHDVPMDPTMENEGSEHSEELIMTDTPDLVCHIDDVGDSEDAAERYSDFAEPTTVRSKHGEASSTSPSLSVSSSFDWNSYLREQNAEPAPKECFFQPDTPSQNKFQIGMKLMIADPRGPSGSSAMFCLGTVVNVYKLWLCVRLEGLDNSHEKWIFCDDESIQPIGPTAEDHMKLNPPIGFIHHHGTFPKFLEQHLKPDDQTGKSMLCPPEWFKPISETLRPTRNYFKVGQKVEAIDQRSFNGKTCPATIAGVTKSQIQIHFDGWNSGYDIKEPYYTRFVMPVGWSQKNGVDISPPMSEAKSTSRPAPLTVPKQSTSQKPKNRPSASKSSSFSSCNNRPSTKNIQTLSDMGVNPVESLRGRGRTTSKRPAKSGTATPPLKKSAEEVSSKPQSSSVEISQFMKVNSQKGVDVESIPVTVQKSQSSENSVEDKVKDLLRNAKVEQQRLAKQLSQPPTAYLAPPKYVHTPPPPFPPQRFETSPASVSFYAPVKNEAEELVSSTTASVDSLSNTGLRQLAPRQSSSQASRSCDLAKVVGRVRPKLESEERRREKLEEASPTCSSSATPMSPTFPRSSPNSQKSNDILLLPKEEVPLKERIMTVFVNHSCNLGPHLNPAMVAGIRRKFGPYATHHALREAVQQLLNCSVDDDLVLNLVQPSAMTHILSVTAHCGGTPRSRFIPCVKSSADAWIYLRLLLRKMKVCENFYSNSSDPCKSCVPGNDLSLEQIVAVSPPIKQWTIEKVASELRNLLEPAVVSKFVEQQIDGRSLGLLTTDLLMTHMGLALGPALKVVDFVQSVRKMQERQQQSSGSGGGGETSAL